MTPDDYECRKCGHSMYVPDGMDPLEGDVRFCSDCMVVELERLQDILREIRRLAAENYDPAADPADECPADVTQHINGLIVRLCDEGGKA